MPCVLYLTPVFIYSVCNVVITLLLHRYQYCICKSSMHNTTCASITLRSLCLVLVLLFKYSYGAYAYMALKL